MTHRRIGVVGGSSVHGGSGDLPTAAEFPGVLAKLTGLDVINLGSPALDSHDHRRQVEELVAFDFDTLVLYAGHNDYGNAWFLERYAGAGGTASALTRATFERSRVYWLLRAWVAPVVYSGAPKIRPGGAGSIDKDATPRDLRMNLRRIAWVCREAGVHLIWMTPASAQTRSPTDPRCGETGPCARTLHNEAVSLAASDPTAATALYIAAADAAPTPLAAPSVAVAATRALAASEGVTLVDAARDLPREGKLNLPAERLFLDPVHFSEAGHTAMAELLVPAVSRW